MAKIKKIPKDINQRAKSIVDIVTSEIEDTKEVEKTDIQKAAAALGRKGGLKGGKARAKVLTAEQRSEIAKKGAAARWHKKVNEQH